MRKKESRKEQFSPWGFTALKKENALKPKQFNMFKISGLSQKVLGIIKFILGICFLPFVYASSVGFLNEFSHIEKSLQNYFWSGIITLLIIYLFIWEPTVIYNKGQRLLEVFFNFFRPLIRIASYLLPIYTIILFIAYWALTYIFPAKCGFASGEKSGGLINYFIFFLGFTIGLHLIFSAKSIRARQKDFLRADYLFGFSLIYIINLLLLAFLLSLVFKNFSLVNFLNNSFQIAKNMFYAVFKQLFL